MKNYLLTFQLLISIVSISTAQENATVLRYGQQITPADLKDYLSIIASDALEGRKTGTRGQKMAAAFISNHFEEVGLTPPVNGTYYQPLDLYSSFIPSAYVLANGFRAENYKDIIYWGSRESGGEVQTEVVFLGQGSEADYMQVDVRNKSVMIWVKNLRPINDLKPVVALAKGKGAKAVFIVSENSKEQFIELASAMENYFSSERLSLSKPEPSDEEIFLIDQAVAQKVFNLPIEKLRKAAMEDSNKSSLRKMKTGSLKYRVSLNFSTLKSENVLGYLEGSDKKNELVIVTAHYDHIGLNSHGEDKINNGADDDGSGTVTVLELAKVFAKAKQEGNGPRRSMLFMTVTGEEEGLFGSEYYAEHPVYPLASTVVDLNIDMIGRTDAEHLDSLDYVYVIGSDKLSTELHELSEKTNATYTNLNFDYTYNDVNHPTNLYKRSDHWNFARKGIPIIFYFDGIHEDYHLPSDEIEKINFDLLAKRAQCIFYTAWEIANRDKRIVVDK